nr:ribonuclease H-like domain-containing protein [Tanacetum cinerariifolium]
MQKRKNDVKARTTLLMSLPNEHQLRFSKYKTAQELWVAILKTFGGNEATKKTKKNLLKQHYGNFKAKGSETLEQTFNRLQDINQIDEDGMEEMDIKWNMALLSMRADGDPRSQDRERRDNYRKGFKVEEQDPKALMAIDGVGRDWSYMANDEENHALIGDEETLTEFALMAKTSAESEVFDNSLCSKACNKNSDSLKSKIIELTDKLFDAKNMIYHYKLGLAQVEARLAEHRSQELKYCETIRVLKFKIESKANCIENLTKDLEVLKKEKGKLKTKLTGFQTTSKDLDSLLESQIMDKNKEGLGYSDVPPPAQIYSPPKKDMSWTGLPEFKDDTVTDYSRPSPAIENTSDDAQNKNPSVTETEATPSTISPKHFIKFVKANDSPTKSKTDKVETAKKPPVKSFTLRPAVHKPYRPPMRPMRSNMNVARSNRTSFNKPAHSYTKRPFQRTSAVRSQYKAPWVPTVNRNFPSVIRKFSTGSRKFPTVNRKLHTVNRKFPTGNTKFSTADMGKKGKALKASACNISYLSDYEPFDRGYVSFGQGGCKITGKGTIKTGKLKLSDDDNVFLRTPRQHNMYSIDLNNIVSHKDLTCLVAKASSDESMAVPRTILMTKAIGTVAALGI